MKKLIALGLAAIAVIAFDSTAISAQTKDAAMGTWILNVAKSTYAPGTAAKSGTRVYTAAAGGKYSMVAEIVGADGKTQKTEYTLAEDGKDYPYKGNPNYDAIMIKRVDAKSVEASLRKSGKEVANSTRTVSADGKTMTITLTGATKSVTVWDKK